MQGNNGKLERQPACQHDTALDCLDQLRDRGVAGIVGRIGIGDADDLAVKVTNTFDLDGSVGLAKLASDTDIGPKMVTQGFSNLGAMLGIDWAQSTAAKMNPSDVWERLLTSGLARDFQQMRLELLRRLARRKDAKTDMPAVVENWAEDHETAIRQFRTMVDRAQAQTPVAPAMLAQVASMARNLLAR